MALFSFRLFPTCTFFICCIPFYLSSLFMKQRWSIDVGTTMPIVNGNSQWLIGKKLCMWQIIGKYSWTSLLCYLKNIRDLEQKKKFFIIFHFWRKLSIRFKLPHSFFPVILHPYILLKHVFLFRAPVDLYQKTGNTYRRHMVNVVSIILHPALKLRPLASYIIIPEGMNDCFLNNDSKSSLLFVGKYTIRY